jgi:hypothetical protein
MNGVGLVYWLRYIAIDTIGVLRIGSVAGYGVTCMHMKPIRQHLLKALETNGWEVTEIDEQTEWYSEECWHVRSVWQANGLPVFLNFLVWGEHISDEKGKPVWTITASTTPAEYFSPRDNDLAVIELEECLRTGRSNEYSVRLIDALSKYRAQQAAVHRI